MRNLMRQRTLHCSIGLGGWQQLLCLHHFKMRPNIDPRFCLRLALLVHEWS